MKNTEMGFRGSGANTRHLCPCNLPHSRLVSAVSVAASSSSSWSSSSPLSSLPPGPCGSCPWCAGQPDCPRPFQRPLVHHLGEMLCIGEYVIIGTYPIGILCENLRGNIAAGRLNIHMSRAPRTCTDSGVAGGCVLRLHPDEVAVVSPHKLLQHVPHVGIARVPAVDHNALHILRQAHWTVDLDLCVQGKEERFMHSLLLTGNV